MEEKKKKSKTRAQQIYAASKRKGGPGTKGRSVQTLEGPEATRIGKKTVKPGKLKTLMGIRPSEPKRVYIPEAGYIEKQRTGEGGEEAYPEGQEFFLKQAKKAGGGMTGVGLYPAEMARAGTMSQAKRKRYMKKGGGITYKMTGGQVVAHGYD